MRQLSALTSPRFFLDRNEGARREEEPAIKRRSFTRLARLYVRFQSGRTAGSGDAPSLCQWLGLGANGYLTSAWHGGAGGSGRCTAVVGEPSDNIGTVSAVGESCEGHPRAWYRVLRTGEPRIQACASPDSAEVPQCSRVSETVTVRCDRLAENAPKIRTRAITTGRNQIVTGAALMKDLSTIIGMSLGESDGKRRIRCRAMFGRAAGTSRQDQREKGIEQQTSDRFCHGPFSLKHCSLLPAGVAPATFLAPWRSRIRRVCR